VVESLRGRRGKEMANVRHDSNILTEARRYLNVAGPSLATGIRIASLFMALTLGLLNGCP
jgi:hypothetical protein